MHYHAIVYRTSTCWVGWIAEYPQFRFERNSRDELVGALRDSITKDGVGALEPRECLVLSGGNGADASLAAPLPADAVPYDFAKGLTLDEIAKRQGIEPVRDPRSLLGTLSEEDFEGFDEFIRELRQSSMAGGSVS